MRSRKVHFLNFRQPMRLDLQARVGTPPVAKIQGYPVWKWTVDDPETKEPFQFVIVQPSDTEIWVGTDVEFLQAVFAALAEGKQVLEDRAEWKEISLSAPVWAVRRYRHDEVKDPVAAGIQMTETQRIDKTATAITFFYNEVRKEAVIRYLTPSTNGLLSLWRSQPETTVIEIKPGVWQISFRIRETSPGLEYLLNVAQLFGFAVFL